MINNTQIEAAKEVLMKYTLPDCLKPQYNGMSAWEISKLMLEASEQAVQNEMGDAHDREEAEALEKSCLCRKCGDPVLCLGIHDEDKTPHELSMCGNCAL